jgi:hypothetical protein
VILSGLKADRKEIKIPFGGGGQYLKDNSPGAAVIVGEPKNWRYDLDLPPQSTDNSNLWQDILIIIQKEIFIVSYILLYWDWFC